MLVPRCVLRAWCVVSQSFNVPDRQVPPLPVRVRPLAVPVSLAEARIQPARRVQVSRRGREWGAQ